MVMAATKSGTFGSTRRVHMPQPACVPRSAVRVDGEAEGMKFLTALLAQVSAWLEKGIR